MAIIPCNQLSLADVFSDGQDIYESDKPEFLSLLQSNINPDKIIPDSFRNHFYAPTGRSPKYPLHIFFCGFSRVPDASKITRFKQDFLVDLQLVFDNLVNLTEPICQAIKGLCQSKSNNSILMDISVMPTKSVLSQMVLVLCAILICLTRTF